MLVPPRESGVRRLSLATAVAIFILAGQANAQVVTVNQSFTGSTAPGWTLGGIGAYTPVLSNTPNGLTLTNSGGNEATYAYDTSSFSSANATIAVSFTYSASSGSAQPADGITFFLANAATVAANPGGFAPGAYGGSLGFAQKTNAGTGGVSGGSDIAGMVGGYLGLGIDQYGNYSNGTEGRIGGINTPTLTPNAIAVRGPGSGLSGYNYLGGTQTLPTNFSATASATPVVTNFELTISATNQVIVYEEVGSTYNQIFTADLSGYSRPANMILGFTGSTGGQDSTQQIANVLLTSVTANLWTNTGADSKWGTTNNWFGNPTNAPGSAASAGNPSDVLLNNAYVSSNQTISLNGNTQTLRALDIDAPFSYIVGSAPHDGTIAFNNEGVLGPSGIYVTHTTGTATQTVNSDLAANNAINIQNNTTSALNLNGNLDTKGNAITFNGSGATTLAGNITNSTGSGSIVQSGTGTTTFSGANTYTGGTTISAGTLNANSSTALGTGAVALDAGGTLGSTNAGTTITNTVNLNGSATLSEINSGGTLNNSASDTLTMSNNATQSGAVNLSTGASANTLTVEVDSGTSTISGVIANGGTSTGDNLTKTGNGTLTLGGSETYTGTTTITGGTIALGKSSVLHSTDNLSIGSNGTLNLGGFNQQVGTLTAASGATLDFGTYNSGNSFVFGSYTPPASGIFTINNWGASDQLADVAGGQNVSTIYISGVGIATEQGTTTSITNLGGTNAYLLLPSTPTQIVWSGTASALWSKGGAGNNWNGSAVPANGQVAVFSSVGQARNNVTVDTNTNNLQGIQFAASSAASYTLGGTKTITLGSNTVPVPYIQQFNALDQTISTTGGVVLGANAVTNETNTGNLIISSGISGGFNLVNDGTGTGRLVLTGANSYNSLFDNSGIVKIGSSTALGNQAATISSGAGLELTGGISPTNSITVGGTGVSGAGVLHNVGGSNTLSGTITESADSTIAADTGTTLTFNNTSNLTGTNTNTTFVGPGTIVTNNISTGTGGVTLSSGTLTFNGANSYTGATTVNGGTLNLSGTGVTVNGGLTVNSGGAVSQTTSNQINTGSTLTMNGGTYNLNGNAQTLNTLTGASGATVTVGTGGNLTLNGSGSSTYAGALSGAGTITQSGTGELSLNGSSAGFTGNYALTQGITNVSGNNNVLGTAAVAVSGTGNFEVQGGLNLANNFTLSTSGASSGNGAIENISGNNTVSGTVTLAGNSRLQSDSGTATLSNTVSLGSGATGYTLNVGGTGNTTISGVIQNGGTAAGSLTKDGTGNLTLSGANTFTGSTTVSAGTLTAGAANVLNTTSGVTVGGIAGSASATLTLGANAQTLSGNLTLNATGTLNIGSGGPGGPTITLNGTTDTLGGTMANAFGTLVVGPGATLNLGANFNDPNLNITLDAGSILKLNGNTDTFGNLTVAGASTVDFYNSGNSIFTVNNVLDAGGFQLSVTNWADNADFFYSSNQSPGAQGSAPLDDIVFTGFAGPGPTDPTKWLPYSNGPGPGRQITPVPEPATYGAIFVGGCLGLFLLNRLPRRKLVVVKVTDRC
jgi:fibronectin-binding autotransporter adhesin